ncbi:pyridoxamine 5'-phosphate oxidase [Pseudonocardia hierapolitana]|uniref:Pyridoxamine 5'-phosphate oxidase n=1 Tax=Pseudonocardia hierapolitana TaxID=1128676 RepID=A0A561SUE9_9PSEU|nr:pyridoxamine 5'-phosphate oxidase family protein [Pseudonocardia hierapolitana]TWF78495.1 pyridoxamine 5'-phosphate oxidase [Pseudonocardia hierapolitana]
MDRSDVAEVLDKPISRELLASSIPARLAYTAVDGDPRVVPVAFHWSGEQLLVFTVPTAAKVRALRENPRVAITIDTQEQWPPRVLLVRGAASLEPVDGVPDEYIEASRKVTPAKVFEDWEAGVRGLYDRMVRITIEPDWAKLLDFETTIPKAVEDLIHAKTTQR